MKRYLIPLLFLVAVGLLTYYYSFVSFLLIGVIVLSLVVLFVLGIVKLFKKNLKKRWLRMPLTTMGICILGIFIGLLRPLPPAIINSEDVSVTLSHAYETDQGDRKNIKFYLGMYRDMIEKRENIRLEQVKNLYDAQLVKKPLDKFHAAFIFHHSRESQLYEIAYKLASEAASAAQLKSAALVQWLAKAAYDRWMLSIGKPQKYGTQGKINIDVN